MAEKTLPRGRPIVCLEKSGVELTTRLAE